MLRRIAIAIVGLAVIGAAAFLLLTRPSPLPPDALAGITGDATHGEAVFWAAGCASCHAAPDAEGDARLVLAGGRAFPSPFGTFVAPNISQDPVVGIGAWSTDDIVTAVTRGVSPDGRHYYPAFPYATYARMTLQDAADLAAFLKTLPADATPSQPHDLPFPFTIRRGIGLWKALFLTPGWVVPDMPDAAAERGRYLAEALAHCGECHTPRGPLGQLQTDRWLAGAPIPGAARGRYPNITPAALDWSEADIVEYLTSGFTPDYDSAGGHMAEVVTNMAHLPAEDRAAIAAYLKAVPPRP